MERVYLITNNNSAKLTEKQTGKAIDAAFKAIKETLNKGEKVTLVEFESFYVIKRKTRKGINPKTVRN